MKKLYSLVIYDDVRVRPVLNYAHGRRNLSAIHYCGNHAGSSW